MKQPPDPASEIDAFISRWESSGANERANYLLFLSQLCDLLGVPQPEPSTPDSAQNAYVVERDVTFDHGDGTTTHGRIDLYKRGCFVLEAKQGSDKEREEEKAARAMAPPSVKKSAKKKGTAVRGTKGWDDAMVSARGQARQYAEAIQNANEGWPPFLIVVDVGHVIELFSEFSCSGKAYVMFPDPQSFRIKLQDLRDEKIRTRLATVWTDPLSLDPSRRSAKVTRELAARLAELAKLLEKAGHEPAAVAKFLMRCLFTMFAEDVELIPRGSFKNLLESMRDKPDDFQPMVEALWEAMNAGEYSQYLRKKLLRFNGGLFAESNALPLDKAMLVLLIEAAKADWADVEPAIFGTLLERALSVNDRHKLGAHFTPRAYVERLVMPTVIEPLRDEWKTVYATAISHAKADELGKAQSLVEAFHSKLCETRILDPACGSGNFLYVTLEHMKRLEGEVLNALQDFGFRQKILLEVDPHQFLGIDINERATAIADLVLWIGYLQWHFRTRGKAELAEPIIKNYDNIKCRDAVLTSDGKEAVLDEQGQAVTRWDGHTKKKHPVTGKEVPDESARVPLWNYINPRKAEWPKADYVLGNPPFLGKLHLLSDFGEGYVEALRATYNGIVPSGVDFVMYWWHSAAQLVHSGSLRQFGLITTNSITQSFNRRVVEEARSWDPSVGIHFAIADHPWVEASDGAAVRIAMTVASRGSNSGVAGEIASETPLEDGSVNVELAFRRGVIHDDLRIGANVASAKPLAATRDVSGTGLILGNRGFVISHQVAEEFRATGSYSSSLIFPLRHGRDLTDEPRNVFVIDATGIPEEELRSKAPAIYQHLHNTVLPERLTNRDARLRKQWWMFRRSNEQIREAISGLVRYIATPETAKHRFFVFLDGKFKPEHRLIVFGFSDAYFLGILSSRIHLVWTLEAGGTLEDRPVYNKTLCFEAFAFPACTDGQLARIRDLGEQLDAHRKRQQELHPGLTMTGMYNVLEKLRSGDGLDDEEKLIHEQGLVSVLRQIHDDLDQAVFAAYGWPGTLGDEEILERLVALNAERAAEEARGLIRWLRPDFQAPQGTHEKQGQLTLPKDEETKPAKKPKTAKTTKMAWPKERSQRTKAIQDALAATHAPITPVGLAKQFLRGNVAQIEDILDALCSLGLARKSRGKYSR